MTLVVVSIALLALTISPSQSFWVGGDSGGGGDSGVGDDTFCPEKCRCNPGYYPVADTPSGDVSDNATFSSAAAVTQTQPTPGPPSLDCRHLDLLDFPGMERLSKVYAHMYFSYNGLSMVHSNTFVGHENIIFLDLSNNDIKHIADSSFINQEDMETLDLSNNKLESIQAEAFYGLKQLTKLYLSGNRLVALDRAVFTYLAGLELIDLSGNQLLDRTLDPQLFRGLTWLESVTLNRMELESLPNELFNEQEISLKELYLEHNNFKSVPAFAFRPVRSALEVIDLNYNHITTIATDDFQNLYSLRQLSISYQPDLDTIETNAFYGLRSLETLDIKFCPKLKHISNTSFADPIDQYTYSDTRWDGKLSTLNLSFNGIQEIPGSLLPWEQIRYVDLRHNPFTCDCHMKWLLTANISTNLTKHITCFSPSWLRNRRLMMQPPRYFRCGSGWDTVPLELRDGSSGRTFRLTLGITCIAITVIFLALVIYVVQRWKVWPLRAGGGRVCDKCLGKLPCSSWGGWSKSSHLKYVTMHDIEERAKEEKDPEVYL